MAHYKDGWLLSNELSELRERINEAHDALVVVLTGISPSHQEELPTMPNFQALASNIANFETTLDRRSAELETKDNLIDGLNEHLAELSIKQLIELHDKLIGVPAR